MGEAAVAFRDQLVTRTSEKDQELASALADLDVPSGVDDRAAALSLADSARAWLVAGLGDAAEPLRAKGPAPITDEAHAECWQRLAIDAYQVAEKRGDARATQLVRSAREVFGTIAWPTGQGWEVPLPEGPSGPRPEIKWEPQYVEAAVAAADVLLTYAGEDGRLRVAAAKAAIAAMSPA